MKSANIYFHFNWPNFCHFVYLPNWNSTEKQWNTQNTVFSIMPNRPLQPANLWTLCSIIECRKPVFYFYYVAPFNIVLSNFCVRFRMWRQMVWWAKKRNSVKCWLLAWKSRASCWFTQAECIHIQQVAQHFGIVFGASAEKSLNFMRGGKLSGNSFKRN